MKILHLFLKGFRRPNYMMPKPKTGIVKSAVLTFLFLSLGVPLFGQLLIDENFDSGLGVFTGVLTGYSTGPNSACNVETAYVNMYNLQTSDALVAANQVGISNGTKLTIQFDYKILDYASSGGNGGNATTAGWGSTEVQYSIDGGAIWTTVFTIDDANHVVSSTCAPIMIIIPASNLPAGSDIQLRLLNTWSSGDYYFYVDDFKASQVFPNIETILCGITESYIHCYENLDLNTWSYSSSNNLSTLELRFIGGGIEACCDEIFIYDGLDNTGTLLYSGNNGGDLAGLSIASTSSNLFFEISSNGNVSCDEGSGCCPSPWEWELICQPAPNDECMNAIVLTESPNDNCVNFISGTTFGGTASTETQLCDPLSHDDVWYSFTPSTNGLYYFNLTNFSSPIFLNVYGGTCSAGLIPIGYFCNSENNSAFLEAGITYLVQVNTVVGSDPTSFDLCAVSPIPPISQTVTCGSIITESFCYDDLNQISWVYASSDNSTLELSFNAGGIEVEYDKIFIFDGLDNTGILLYAGDNGGDLKGITVNSFGPNLFFQLVSDFSISCGANSFCCTTELDWEVVCIPPPPNDECLDAIVITETDSNCSTTISGSTIYATQSQDNGICPTNNNDVWYSFTPLNTADYSFELSNTSVETFVNVYSGTCASGLVLEGACLTAGSYLVDLAMGVTYLIQVHTESYGVSTDFDLCIYACDIIVPEYCAYFEGDFPELCWIEASSTDGVTGLPSDFGSGDWSKVLFANSGLNTGYSARINLYNLDSEDWLITPYFDLSNGIFDANFTIALTGYEDSSGADTLLLGDDVVEFLITTDGGASWTILETWDSNSSISALGQSVSISLASYTGSVVKMAFRGDEGLEDIVEGDVEFFFDDFCVELSCPTSLSLIGPNSGDGSDSNMLDNNASSGNISSSQTILSGSTIIYNAGTEIELVSNFTVELGATFEAFIDGCGSGSEGSNIQNDNEIKEAHN